MLKHGKVEKGVWNDTANGPETRTYIFPQGDMTIERVFRVMVKESGFGHSHRVLAYQEDGETIDSYYVPAGWMSIVWEGVDGSKNFGW